MSLEVFNNYRNSKSIKEQCESYLFFHAVIVMTDGTSMDGIIEKIDGDCALVLVGEDANEQEMRQPNRYRRYMPRRVPFGGIGGVLPIPYPIVPIPYPVPYPFYPI